MLMYLDAPVDVLYALENTALIYNFQTGIAKSVDCSQETLF